MIRLQDRDSAHVPLDVDDLNQMLERYYEVAIQLRPKKNKVSRQVVSETIRQITGLRKELRSMPMTAKRAKTEKTAQRVLEKLRSLR